MPISTERYPLTVEQKKQLDRDLVTVEATLDAMRLLMCACYGDDSPAAIRAGETTAALQRLKWQIARMDQGQDSACQSVLRAHASV
jgi:hypothetical protein